METQPVLAKYQSVHLSAECFPIAKVGGLGDVAGALPKYLNLAGVKSCAFLPYYNQKWNAQNKTIPIYHGSIQREGFYKEYFIRFYKDAGLGFDIFFVDMPDLLYRENVYGYDDDPLRFLFFQQAALDWLCTWKHKPEVFHCHDYHTGLIPFMIHQCPSLSVLKGIKTVFTIHNGLYTGAFEWSLAKYFPHFYLERRGLLEWNNVINPLASAIKCCDRLTTVSEGYLEELKAHDNPLHWLYNEFWQKSKGIVNGIDTEVWDPVTDENLASKYTDSWDDFKLKNKKAVCESVGLNPDLPLTVFIGRLNVEKGGEVLTQGIEEFVHRNRNMNFYVLGSGANNIEDKIRNLSHHFKNTIANYIGYNEALAHRLYAAADFLIMPSIIEPCGLNQLYALRYATIPMVRSVGGLKDTVVDFGEEQGYGIRFDKANAHDVVYSLNRAVALYADKIKLKSVRKHCVALDFSWTKAVKKYIEIYKN